MKPILIHSNNTHLLKHFQENEWYTEKFSSSLKVDLDVQLDEFINANISTKDIDIIFIKVSLSNNYLELLGLRLGIHIRLSYIHSYLQKLPIVFLGEESLDELCRIYCYPEIIYQKGVYLISESAVNIQLIMDRLSKGKLPGCVSLDSIIYSLNILPPSNYQSHHSIANEWSILRWAKVLDIDENNVLLKGVKKNIDGLLYYKYLQSKYPIVSEPDKGAFKINGKGKILYIDDEWNKGWDIVLKEFLKISPELTSDFEVFEYDFKDKDEDIILNECKNRIISSDPAIVILDLRLANSDFDPMTMTSALSGFKLLTIIKKINPGIRVIIFTASNKVWNFIELQNFGANGFVLKESPEFGVVRNFTFETIEKFALLLQDQLEYQFQKKLFIICKEVKSYLVSQITDENPDYNKLINTLLKQIEFVVLSINFVNLKKQVTLDIVFLNCYNFLEQFKSYYLIYKNDYRYYIGVDEVIFCRYEVSGKILNNKGPWLANSKFDSPSWFNTLAALFVDYFGIRDAENNFEITGLKKISEMRNNYIHSIKELFSVSEVELIMNAIHCACMKIRE